MILERKLTFNLLLTIVSLVTLILFVSSWVMYTEIKSNRFDAAQNMLMHHVKDAGMDVGLEFKAKISAALTLTTDDTLTDALQESNQIYAALDSDQRQQKIKQLDQRWRASEVEEPFVQSYLSNSVAQALKNQEAAFPNVYGELFLTNRYGALVGTTAKLTTLAHGHKYWWKNAFKEGYGSIFLDDRGYDDSVGDYVVGVVVPVKKNGEVIGILKANVRVISALGELVVRHNALQESEILIARSQGKIVFREGLEPLSRELPSPLMDLLKVSNLESRQVKLNGVDYFVSQAPLKIDFLGNFVELGGTPSSIDHSQGNMGENWHIFALRSTESVLSSWFDRQPKLIIGIFILVISTLLIGWWAARVISHQQSELRRHLDRYNQQLKHDVEVAINERKAAQEILQHQSKMAIMGEMIGLIAHQWRQPLNVLSIRIQKLRHSYLENKVDAAFIDEFIESNQRNIEYMSQTIDDFRSFFRTDRVKRPFELKQIIYEVLKLQGALLKKHNIDVIIDGKPLHLVGLKNDIKQVFMNLFSNSKDAFIKQSVYHPRVWIRVTETGVSFEDNAGGVPETILSKLFNAYFTTKPEGSGTGLGLHMCRQIVEEKMGGTIQASNTPNGLKIVMNFSTTAIFDSDEVDEPEESVDMNFSAPATEASLDGSVKQENSSAMLNVQELKKAKEQGVKSVLLVDDDEISRTILDEFLTANGYIVSNLENGQQALEILSHSEYLFDYVLMDIQMPVLDGIDATKKARHRGVSIPILGLSAYTDVEHQKAAKEAGMLGLVSKPINAEKLLVRLSEVDKNSDHT